MIHTNMLDLLVHEEVTERAPSQPLPAGTVRRVTDGVVFQKEEVSIAFYIAEHGESIMGSSHGTRLPLPMALYHGERSDMDKAVQERVASLLEAAVQFADRPIADPRPVQAIKSFFQQHLKQSLVAIVANKDWAEILEPVVGPDVKVYQSAQLVADDVVLGVSAPEFTGHIVTGPLQAGDPPDGMRVGLMVHGQVVATRVAKEP